MRLGWAGMLACVAVAGLAALLSVAGLRLTVSQSQALSAPVMGEPVVTMTLRLVDEIRVERRFPGRIEAPRQTAIGFEVGGRVRTVTVREGERVVRGAELARLDTEGIALEREGLVARVTSLRDQAALALREVERLERLVSRGSAPANSLDRARTEAKAAAAALAEAEAELAGADLRLRQASLLAPEDGVVGAVLVRPDETVAAGQPLLSIFQDGPGQLRVSLPPDLDPAAFLEPRLEIAGQTYPVALLSARPDIDPATNSRSALFVLPRGPEAATAAALMPGQTGQLVAKVAQRMRGAWVPIEALRPNPEGTWMLVGVSADQLAERIDVEVLHLSGPEALVAGAFGDGDRVVAGGVHKIVPGQLLHDAKAQGP